MPVFSHLSSFFRPWVNQIGELRKYWVLYGGRRGIVHSPYAQLSFVFSVFVFIFEKPNVDWAELSIGIIPSLLGFTLGAMAITIAFSSSNVFKFLAEEGEPESYFMKLTANFVHFIVVQVLALVFGLVLSVTNFCVLKYLVAFLIFYGIMAVLSTGILLFQSAFIYNAASGLPPPDDTKD